MPDQPNLEEQALSEAAAMTISTQLDEVENLDVDVKSNLSKIVQGKADSISLDGQGLVIQKDIRVQEMQLQTEQVDINPLSALFGQLKLNKPVDATARFVINEQDLNQALNSDYIRNNYPNLQIIVEGQTVTLEPQKLEVFLVTNNKMTFKGTILIQENTISRSLNFMAIVCLPTPSQPLLLEAFHCAEGEGVTLEFALALLQKAKQLLNSPYIELEGMALLVKHLEVQAGNLTLHTEAYVRQLPNLDSGG
ncbi:MAG: DUF2993 domain-containing protein [Coleofasciculaceae cyanobacterium]